MKGFIKIPIKNKGKEIKRKIDIEDILNIDTLPNGETKIYFCSDPESIISSKSKEEIEKMIDDARK